MKEPLIYISVSVEKELPKEDGVYFFITIEGDKSGNEYNRFMGDNYYKQNFESYLKEFSLPELMEEAIREYMKTYLHSGLTQEQFVTDFLTQKGILTKDSGFFDEEF